MVKKVLNTVDTTERMVPEEAKEDQSKQVKINTKRRSKEEKAPPKLLRRPKKPSHKSQQKYTKRLFTARPSMTSSRQSRQLVPKREETPKVSKRIPRLRLIPKQRSTSKPPRL